MNWVDDVVERIEAGEGLWSAFTVICELVWNHHIVRSTEFPMDFWLKVLVNLCGWCGKTHNVWVDLIVFLRSRVSLGLCIISNVAELKFGAWRDCCWCVGICKCVKFQTDENLQHFQLGRLFHVNFHVFGRPVEVRGWFICVGFCCVLPGACEFSGWGYRIAFGGECDPIQ